MSALIILIVFGLGMAFFATQNTGLTTITVGNLYSGGIPLYIVVIGSMLLGILISWLISLVNSLTASFKMRKINAQIRDANQAIDELKKQNTELLKQNAALRSEQEEEVTEDETNEAADEEPVARPNVFRRTKQILA